MLFFKNKKNSKVIIGTNNLSIYSTLYTNVTPATTSTTTK